MHVIAERPPDQYFEEAPMLPPVTKTANLGQEEAVDSGIIHSSGDLCDIITIAWDDLPWVFVLYFEAPRIRAMSTTQSAVG